ncbi:MAG TPA: AAA family ATPase [Streptosporangiaceae bacterium]|nr:AAA family ATPase [Streptosporangiaceae bacterium]
MTGGVWLVTGVQAAGKSTIADSLARQFERGVHIRGGQYYRSAVRGWVHVGDPRADEARRLLDLRYRLAALVADEYCNAGFTAVVQDNIFGADVPRWLGSVVARPRHLIVLRPSVAVVSERERQRHAVTGKTAYRPGGFTVEDLDEQLAATPRIGLWLDTSAMTPAETVAEILRHQSEAVVA